MQKSSLLSCSLLSWLTTLAFALLLQGGACLSAIIEDDSFENSSGKPTDKLVLNGNDKNNLQRRNLQTRHIATTNHDHLSNLESSSNEYITKNNIKVSKNRNLNQPRDELDTAPGEEERSWRFITISDMHTMAAFSWNGIAINKGKKIYQDQANVLRYIHDNYGGELVLTPGDIASFGGTRLSRIIEKLGLGDISDQEAVLTAGMNCYNTAKELFREAGYWILLATIGDHEIGGNDSFFVDRPGFTKVHTIPQARQAFGNAFNRNHNNDFFLFDYQPWFGGDKSDDVTSRPLSTKYENTTFAYVHQNALFVTVDAFEIVGDGSSDFIDRENGSGGEGAVTCTVDGDEDHLRWFENVLRKGRDDPAIRHIIVQAHLPIIQPVKKIFSSGQFFDNGEESVFWNLMNKYGVDLYFAGEVHSNTVTKTRHEGSNLIQIVSRGNFYNNFLTIDVADNKLDVKIYDEIGDQRQFNLKYEESGHLSIDKTTSVTKLSSSGVLKLLDLDDVILMYDFEDILPLGTRKVPGFRSDSGLMKDVIKIRGEVCSDSIYNQGQFGAQYDAQVCNLVLGPGRIGGRSGWFNDRSRMAMIASGPFSAGDVISFGLWFKTWQYESNMVLIHYADYWGGHVRKSQEKDHFTLTLESGIPVINTQPVVELRSIDPTNLADGNWHHIAVSMPRKSCYLSELQVYVDGSIVSTSIIGNRRIFQTTSGRMSIGGYGYSKSGFEDAYPGTGPYIGMLDDFVLFSRPLQIEADFPDVFATESPTASPVSRPPPSNFCNDGSQMFFWKMSNDESPSPILKECTWLQDITPLEKILACYSNDWFYNSIPPAKLVCHLTCGYCAGS